MSTARYNLNTIWVESQRNFRESRSKTPKGNYKKILDKIPELSLEEKIYEIKQVLKFNKNQYLSPSNDASQTKKLYSVRLHHISSFESLGEANPTEDREEINWKLGAPAFLLQDKTGIEAWWNTESTIQLNKKKESLDSKIKKIQLELDSLKVNIQTPKINLEKYLNQIEKSIEIISKTQNLKGISVWLKSFRKTRKGEES